MDAKKVAVLGLGVEGKNAIKSLKKRGYRIYASDKNRIDFKDEEVEVDLGKHDINKILSCDFVVISPSMWNTKLASLIKKKKKVICDVFNKHKSIYTIGVTGTNGKTTTSLMIYEILKNSKKNVLIGGNAGGGFEGYTELILEANEGNYEYMVIEICDMTLDFVDDCFDLDMVVVTNIGEDHLNYHKTLENFRRKLKKFLKNKIAILNSKDPNLVKLAKELDNYIFYDEYDVPLFGRFNKLNAGAAAAAAKFLGIDPKIISHTLKNFKLPKGRLKHYNINNKHIIIGKTDNKTALEAVLNEMKFDAMFIGTPRRNEYWRFKILDVAYKSSPKLIVLFPGLEDTVDMAKKRLEKLGFKNVVTVKTIDEIVKMFEFILEKYEKIFIGGNGQKKINKIQDILEAKFVQYQ